MRLCSLIYTGLFGRCALRARGPAAANDAGADDGGADAAEASADAAVSASDADAGVYDWSLHSARRRARPVADAEVIEVRWGAPITLLGLAFFVPRPPASARGARAGETVPRNRRSPRGGAGNGTECLVLHGPQIPSNTPETLRLFSSELFFSISRQFMCTSNNLAVADLCSSALR
ncbi:hypothetical protein M885DRAFT_533054 [Pelagophyceae sp. CCMP2097]|nr:hypothetical protein M885DRAFT_533054 [Pelagophyceae sp. CCMP2097]